MRIKSIALEWFRGAADRVALGGFATSPTSTAASIRRRGSPTLTSPRIERPR
jgi:hypothetical protein